MQAIQVKFLGPTNIRGSRYKATCASGSITLGVDHALHLEQNAARAAVALCNKLGWSGLPYGDELIVGGLPNGSYVFVFAHGSQRYPTKVDGQ
jgi:hypothetical protein